MNSLQRWSCCPESIEIGDGQKRVRLIKRDDLYAIRGSVSGREVEDLDLRLADDDISIMRGSPSSERRSDRELLPVYAASEDSTPAVATQRIFLRLTEDATIDSVRSEIDALDMLIAEIPTHAPHCAWLEPKSGRVDEALSRIESLRALPHAAHAEPQLLRPRGWKRAT